MCQVTGPPDGGKSLFNGIPREKEIAMSERVNEFIRSQQQWEYRRLEAPAAESLNDRLMEIGREGWELTTVVYCQASDVWHGFLKRPRAHPE